MTLPEHLLDAWRSATGARRRAAFVVRHAERGPVVDLDEVVVTLFLAGPEQVTLPRQMFTGIRENISPTIAADCGTN